MREGNDQLVANLILKWIDEGAGRARTGRPALSPRVSSAIVFTANWSLYL